MMSIVHLNSLLQFRLWFLNYSDRQFDQHQHWLLGAFESLKP